MTHPEDHIPGRVGEPWSEDEDAAAWIAHQHRLPVERIAKQLGRTPSAVRRRLGLHRGQDIGAADLKLRALLRRTIWTRTDAVGADRLDHGRWVPVRTVNSGAATGRIYSAKLRRHVQYESALEFRAVAMLDASSSVIWYREQPLRIPYELSGVNQIYVPDFLVEFDDRRVVLVEIKPRHEQRLSINEAKFAAALELCDANGWGFMVTDLTS